MGEELTALRQEARELREENRLKGLVLEKYEKDLRTFEWASHFEACCFILLHSSHPI